MAAKTGDQFKFYYNSATDSGEPDFDTPTWVLVCNIKDVDRDLSSNSADASSRCGSGYRQKLAGLKEGKVEFTMNYDPDDTAMLYFRDAYDAKTLLHVADADGLIATAGTIYWHAPVTVTNFSQSEPLEEVATVTVTLEVAYHSTQAPAYETVSA